MHFVNSLSDHFEPTLHRSRVSQRPVRHGEILESELLIVGAGPVGIVLALELADRQPVLLVDSGTWRRDSAVQALADLAPGSDRYHVSMNRATQRRIGGASNLWGGRCVPYDPVDFDVRAVAPDVEWPLTYDDIANYHQRACDWCACGDAVFNAMDVPELANHSLVPGFADGSVRATDLERWSLPTNFRRHYGARLKDHPNIRLLTGFTCTELVTGRDGATVSHALARSLDGRTITLRATRYVLALGGVEATRLLFASSRLHPAGLGNSSGHLGRWYMAHVECRVAAVHFTTNPADTIYGYEQDPNGVFVRRRLTLHRGFQLDNGLSNAALWLVNPDVADARHGNPVLSFVYLMLASPAGHRFVAQAIREKHLEAATTSSVRQHLRNVLRDPLEVARFATYFAYGRFLKRGRRLPGFFVPSDANVYPLVYHGEHLPRWDSYLARTDVVDALGMPRLRSHLRFGEQDLASVSRALSAVDTSLRTQRLGKVQYIFSDTSAAVRAQLFGGFHQTGTTRMAHDPRAGVVDSDLRLHDSPNVYVASTGVLPTSSQANSTFVAIALAVRLAEHLLASELDRSEVPATPLDPRSQRDA
jgi:choline dehydrogenase-like flavoprotein